MSPAVSATIVMQVIDAIQRKNWNNLEPLLHESLQWTRGNGMVVSGRVGLMTALQNDPKVQVPWSHELRDGQIYRWIEPSS